MNRFHGATENTLTDVLREAAVGWDTCLKSKTFSVVKPFRRQGFERWKSVAKLQNVQGINKIDDPSLIWSLSRFSLANLAFMRRKKGALFIIFGCVFLVLISFIGFSDFNFFRKDSVAPVADSVLFSSAPVLSPEEALQTFELEPGFRIELVASEPLIQDPVAMDFDAAGRLWVVEMQSYMPDTAGTGEENPTGRIVILEDVDQDGRMDKSKVFMDGLVLPRAITVVNQGVLFAAPPNLWFVENNDDKPGKKVLVDSAYAVGGNVEHQPNGLMRGIDNWYYNAKSRYRYRYQSGQWIKEETEFRGQWGIAKDNYGRLLYNNNSNQLRGDLLPPGTMIRNPDFNSREGINIEIAEDQRVYPIRPTPGVNRGYQEKSLDDSLRLRNFTAACGPVVYRGDQFPEGFSGDVFVCEPSGNLIKRNIIKQDGPYIKAEQAYAGREFLASKDERFRPVNLYNAPDGSLYMVDMYRGVIQHKTFLTDYLRAQIKKRGLAKPIGLGRIYRIVYEGNWIDRLVQNFKSPLQPEKVLLNASGSELIAYLSHPNGWWRDTAQRLLVEQNQQDVVPQLLEVLKDGGKLAKIHALWTLEGLGVYAPDIIEPGFQAEEPEVIATAVRVTEKNAGTGNSDETLKKYNKLLNHENLQVQLQLALSLGEFIRNDSPGAMKMLTTIALEHGEDKLMQEAITSSVNGKEGRLLALIAAESPKTMGMMNFLNALIASDVQASRTARQNDLSKADRQKYILGKTIYESTCAGCHQTNGEGLVPIAPPLNKSEWVTGPVDRLVLISLYGLRGPVTVRGKVYKEPEVQPVMPGLKDNPDFTDENMAAVLTYIRNAWDNQAEGVDAAKVKSLREHHQGRETPFTASELNQGL